eukprot:5186910-Amphidinium_carterae.2
MTAQPYSCDLEYLCLEAMHVLLNFNSCSRGGVVQWQHTSDVVSIILFHEMFFTSVTKPEQQRREPTHLTLLLLTWASINKTTVQQCLHEPTVATYNSQDTTLHRLEGSWQHFCDNKKRNFDCLLESSSRLLAPVARSILRRALADGTGAFPEDTTRSASTAKDC